MVAMFIESSLLIKKTYFEKQKNNSAILKHIKSHDE